MHDAHVPVDPIAASGKWIVLAAIVSGFIVTREVAEDHNVVAARQALDAVLHLRVVDLLYNLRVEEMLVGEPRLMVFQGKTVCLQVELVGLTSGPRVADDGVDSCEVAVNAVVEQSMGVALHIVRKGLQRSPRSFGRIDNSAVSLSSLARGTTVRYGSAWLSLLNRQGRADRRQELMTW